MSKWLLFLLIGFFGLQNTLAQEFVSPETPLKMEKAPSPNVVNGHVFEKGSVKLPEKSQLILPDNAIVEEYEGETVQFFLTKVMHFVGQPPTSMKLFDARGYFGLAYQKDEGNHTVSTFGEWKNRDGAAQVKLLVLVPRGQSFRKSGGLSGPESEASSRRDLGNPALETCYWYAGIEPQGNWERMNTELQFNRFLAPK